NNWRELDYDEYMAKVKPKHSHLIGLAKYPKQFKSTGVKTLVARALHILYVQRRIIYIIGNRQNYQGIWIRMYVKIDQVQRKQVYVN
ncbi:MAG: hypothetical protein QOK81_07415, partial [Nitrososphaeraceae archaeon]|nr:hypothetical protein [Nitrososphaeraceae archaeon]